MLTAAMLHAQLFALYSSQSQDETRGDFRIGPGMMQAPQYEMLSSSTSNSLVISQLSDTPSAGLALVDDNHAIKVKLST